MAYLLSQKQFFDAARNGNVHNFLMMVDAGMDINLPDMDTGATPMHHAATKGCLPVLEILIKRGADPNIRDLLDRTPLHYVVEGGYDDAAMFLVAHGARVDMKDRRNQSPMDLATSALHRRIRAFLKGETEEAGKTSEEKHVVFGRASTRAILKQDDTAAAAAGVQEVFRIYTPNGTYKTVRVTGSTRGSEFLKAGLERFNLPESVLAHVDLLENRKGQRRRVAANEIVYTIKQSWPRIVSDDPNEAHKQCHFLIEPKASCPPDIRAMLC